MKKAFTLLLVLLAGFALVADDALTLPAGVLRTYITGAYAFGDQEFDANGDKVDASSSMTIINLGMAIEYGVNDWISAAVQWAPGWNVSSEFDPDPLAFFSATSDINGPFDIFAGAKIQIVGPKAPVANEAIRFAVAPGVKIPLPGADFQAQLADFATEKKLTLADPDKHALGIGGRVYLDYILNELFFLNLHAEYIKYFEKTDAGMIAFLPGPTYVTQDVAYGYSLKLEFEPHFEYALPNNAKFSAGLPVTYFMWPETEYNGTAKADSEGYGLSIGPSASYFFLAGPLPFEVKLGYNLPLMGKNTSATNQVVFQLKSYLKF